MSWIERYLSSELTRLCKPGKVFVLYGPRRTGKTSIIEQYLNEIEGKTFKGTGDDFDLRQIFSSQKQTRIISNFKGYDTVFIDEAQSVRHIGMGLKILIDGLPELRIIVTGSSSFKLSHQIGEPLTGRQTVSMLYPISVGELNAQFGGMEVNKNLDEYLIFGMYPETLTMENHSDKKDYLIQLRNSYLFKDILELENLRNGDKLNDLLKLLAFQIGNEVSLNELSISLGIAKQTVFRYLELLERAFIIKKINGFSRNLRNEITKTHRYYFLDNGIRNAVINNFNDMGTRMDQGMLWENFCFIERLKKQEYQRIYSNNYFWRTYTQQEIDMVEERDGKLYGYEFKWNTKKKPKSPKLWTNTYPDATFQSITPDNFLEFVT